MKRQLISLVTLTLLYQLATTLDDHDHGHTVTVSLKKKCLANAEGCYFLPSGLTLMKKGIDITVLDLHPLKGFQQKGLLKPIIQFDCKEQKGFSSPHNETYQIPDQIWHLTTNPMGVKSVRAESMRTSKDVKKYLNVEIGISASSPMGTFSFSMTASYKHMERKCVKEEKSIQDVSSYESAHSVYFVPPGALTLDVDAQRKLDNLKNTSFESNRKMYNKFVEEYGTHYFSRADFGGRLRFYKESTKKETYSRTNQELSIEAEASFFGRFNLKMKTEAKRDSKKKNSKDETKDQLWFYGGSVDSFNKGIAEWADEVDKNPWLVSGDLKPITDLIKDCQVRENMQKAVFEYVMRKYLIALKRRLDYAPEGFRHNPVYMNFVNTLKEMKKLDTLVEGDVKELSEGVSHQLDVPGWFAATKICFRKEPTGDGGQCRSDHNPICSRINEDPSWYMDDTDNRQGGCKMQWGITSDDDFSAWFSNVQLCYKFSGPASFCGRYALRAGIYCAPVNSFTSPYEDDTDARRGHCAMSWSLRVPDDAPLWFHRVKLCFDSQYTNYDGRHQCRFGGNRRCVNNNEWTDNYLDSSDQRNGGCRLRWKLTMD